MFACKASDTTVHSITKNCNVKSNEFFINRRTLKKVNFRQTLPKHVQYLQSGAAVKQNGGCLFCVSSSGNVQNGEKKFFLVSTICSSGSLFDVVLGGEGVLSSFVFRPVHVALFCVSKVNLCPQRCRRESQL